MATRIDTMIQRLAETRATGAFDNPDMVGLDTAPSWVRGMVREGWIEERDLGDGVRAWYVTDAWHEIERARAALGRPVGRPRHARVKATEHALTCSACAGELTCEACGPRTEAPRTAVARVVTFALLCPQCSCELARGNEAEWPQQSFDCPCGQKGIVVPHAKIEALFA